MCIIPIVFMLGAMFLYIKKFILDDATYEKIKAEIATRNSVNASEDAPEDLTGGTEEPGTPFCGSGGGRSGRLIAFVKNNDNDRVKMRSFFLRSGKCLFLNIVVKRIYAH